MSQYPTTFISEPPAGIAPDLPTTSISAPLSAKLHSPSATKDPAIVADAIERAGIILLRDSLGNYYTIEQRKGLAHLSAARLTTWLPQHTDLAVTPLTAQRILASAELAAISTPCELRLPLTPSLLEDLVRAIHYKL